MDVKDLAAVHPAASTAEDIMSSPAVTVSPDASRTQIADILTQHRISGVPVVDELGRVLGLVSEYDLLAHSGSDATQLMTSAVITVTVATSVEDVKHLLIDRGIRRVPVLQHGQLVGVVSRGDVVATMATEWVCEVCGEPVRGEKPLDACAKCGSAKGFRHQEQSPGP